MDHPSNISAKFCQCHLILYTGIQIQQNNPLPVDFEKQGGKMSTFLSQY